MREAVLRAGPPNSTNDVSGVRSPYGAALTERTVIGYAWQRCWLRASLPYLTTSSDVRQVLAAGEDVSPGFLVVLVDGEPDASAAIGQLRSEGATVLLLIAATMTGPVRRALRAGVDGMVTLGDPIAAMQVALDLLTHRESYVSPLAARLLLDEHRLRPAEGGGATDPHLSDRERAVLQAMVDGLTTKATARRLGLAVKTVEAHRSRAFARLRVRSQSEAVTRVLAEPRLLRRSPTSSPG